MAAIIKAIEAAGLTFQEAAKITKVSRATLYNWKNGTPPKNQFLYDNAERIAAVIMKAVELRKLPAPDHMGVLERLTYIQRVLGEVYQDLYKN